MWIPDLTLTNFRNYRSLELDLPRGQILIHGDNAQGKTNLLEAVYLLATTRSYRTASDRELVNHNAAKEENITVTRLFAHAHRERGDIKLEVALQAERAGSVPEKQDSFLDEPSFVSLRKRIRVNDIPRRAIDVVGQVNVVMFAAQDIDLLSGTPVLCRRYLDLINSQIDPRYLRALQRYNRVLVQRNHLLRLLQERRAQPEQLEFWDRELIENGTYLIKQRRNLVAMLDELAEKIHTELSGGREKLKLIYLPSVGSGELPDEVESHFQRALLKNRGREIKQGVTVVGPHRDNLQFLVNGIDMSKYGSRGQQRTVVLSLKLAEARHMYMQTGDSPVLLLDDVLSELDQARRHHLLEYILPFQQVLITATDLDCFDNAFLAQAARLEVVQGKVEFASGN